MSVIELQPSRSKRLQRITNLSLQWLSCATALLCVGTPSHAYNMGVNTGGISDYDTTYLLTDVMKQGRNFATYGNWGVAAAVDSNGWPNVDAQIGVITSPSQCEAGAYHITFTGSSTAVVAAGDPGGGSFPVTNRVSNGTAQSCDVNVPVGAQGMQLYFSSTGGGAKNIQCIRPKYVGTGKVFTDEFLSAIAPFSTLRFMDMTNTNGSGITNWSDRTPEGYASYSNYEGRQLPWGVICDLGIATGKDIWINIPQQATDDYVTQLATLLKNKLVGTSVHVYVEYSNEVWNSSFTANGYTYNLAQSDPSDNWDNTTDGGLRWGRWLGAKMANYASIFKTVWGAAAVPNQVRPVLCWQQGNDAFFDNEFQGITHYYGTPSTYIYGLAQAPYYYAGSQWDPVAYSDTSSVSAILSDWTGSSDFHAPDNARLATKAHANGMKALTYEGGPDDSCYGNNSCTNQTPRLNANLDPGVTNVLVHATSVDFFGQGGDMYMYYDLVSAYGLYGYWGLGQSITDTNTPKWQAIYQLAGSAPTIPAAPTNLTATAGNGQVVLSWSASSGATSYNVKRSTVSGSGYAAVASPTSTNYTNTGLTNGTTYYFVVTATNTAGTSGNSNQVSVTPTSGGTLTPIIQLGLNEGTGTTTANTGSAGGSLTLTATVPTWSTNAPTNAGSGHAVDFGTTAGNYGIDSAGVISSLAGLSQFTITGWVNCRNNTVGMGGNRIVTWINNGANGGDLVFNANGSLTLGVNAWPDSSTAVSSASKITVDGTAGAANWRFFAVTYDGTVGTNNVSWYFGTNSAGVALDITNSYNQGAVGASVGPLTVGHFNTLTRSGATDRMFRGLIDDVRVYGSVLSAAQISTVQGSTGGSIPAAPAGLTATAGNAQAALAWTASTGATSYNVSRSTVSGSGYASVATGIATTSYTNTGLTNGTTYYYVVTATNATGTSGNSNQASATPSAGPAATPTFSPVGGTYTSAQSVMLADTTTGAVIHYTTDGSTPSASSTTYSSAINVSATTTVKAIAVANGFSNSAVASATYTINTGGTNIQINAGGPAVSPFVADADFSGGLTATNWTGAIDTSAVTSPAPQAVYQSERYGTCTYTIPGLTPGTNYTVRLHFCENYFTASAQRTFNAAINGTAVLTNYDIFASTGAIHKATVQQFSATGNSSGQIVIALTNVVNNALVNGIEVSAATATAPAAPTGLTATAGNAQVVLSWTASSGATSYNVKRATVTGGPYTTVASPTTTSYTNTGLTNGTIYYFVVTATNATGTSGNSNQANATPAANTNKALSGVAYAWHGNSSATADTNKTAAPGLNDNNTTTDVYLNAGSDDIVNAWESGGVTWTTVQTITKVVYINGTYDAALNGVFTAGFGVQYTTDGMTWVAAPGWTLSPAYTYDNSASGGATFTFTGTALSNVKGVRIVGQVRTGTSGSWDAAAREIQAF